MFHLNSLFYLNIVRWILIIEYFLAYCSLLIAHCPLSICLQWNLLPPWNFYIFSKTFFMDDQQRSSFLGQEETPLYVPTNDERILAILAHILTLVGSFIPPLVIYLLKKDESSFVATHARESLNFQITIFIIIVILTITIFGILLIWFVGIIDMVLVIVATIRASENKLYRYPFSIRLVK